MSPSDRTAEPGDGEVVARVLAGEHELFRVLVKRHQDMLHAHAMRMTGQRDVAADLVQSALVKAFTRLDRCRNPDRFGSWAFRIVANGSKDYLKNVRRGHLSLDAVAPLAGQHDPARDTEQRALRRRLDDAFSRLPPDQREAFVMKHEEGRSYEEMSDLLGASVGALKMRVHRAREMLARWLEDEAP